jgi:preprotein translocase subunit Sec63
MNEKSLITDEQSFDGASYASGYSIQTYDDGFGPLWISRNSIGINGIVRAKTWEDAYSICEDEFFPEADETIEEIVKEYGFKREHKKVVRDANGERFERYPEDYPNGKLAVEFVRWETIETPDPEAWSENELFQEAFGFRNNGPNARDTQKHGIYSKDLNSDALDRLTAELVADLGITLDISDNE